MHNETLLTKSEIRISVEIQGSAGFCTSTHGRVKKGIARRAMHLVGHAVCTDEAGEFCAVHVENDMEDAGTAAEGRSLRCAAPKALSR